MPTAATEPTADRPKRRVGRPRIAPEPGPSADAAPRDQLLAAAAELFTVQGYTATSTRAIAARAGMRQASMYYHFASKEALLSSLLEATVAPSLEFAEWALAERGAAAEARLWALARIDAAQLAGARHNLGALYLLPELRQEAFAPFRGMRERLRESYRDLLGETAASLDYAPGELAQRAHLVFGLVEGVILARLDNRLDNGPLADPVSYSAGIADGALRLAGSDRLDAAREQGRRLCAEWIGRSEHLPSAARAGDRA
ncbi:TetR/AcrR family transcriptional regulator [Glycomyces harbinensis]|uniref:Transcriptional regulator, TetR family n=1 Tax=Glycomyces harbinensis TaxID=58114 RepID=A0A1G7BBU0_9ACTN|nr:TetR/AcrR family transcriptional regulator [Glycomyces harbinensis]SDE24367.1 transcriptional regulator, TetR family [Glycomyces harbinensis]